MPAKMTQHDNFEAGVEEIHAALMEQFPDPGDVPAAVELSM